MKHTTAALASRKLHAEQQRTKLYGPPPINPFKDLRLSHEFTHEDLSNKIYISRQALIRLEQGTYYEPLPSVLSWWAEHFCNSSLCPANKSSLNPGEPLGELLLRDLYSEYQALSRRRFTLCFGPTLEFEPSELDACRASHHHPMRILRDRVDWSITETAKNLCLPQYTLEHFEKKFRSQQSLPKHLRSVLNEIGYPIRDITDFAYYYQEFRRLNRKLLNGAAVG